MSGHQPQSAGGGPQGSGMNIPPQQASGPPPAQNASQQNLNQIVSTRPVLLSLAVFNIFLSEQLPPKYNQTK
jgi:hypothetical protein